VPRKARFFVADVPAHVVQRGNNRQAIFFAENDYRVYLGWLKDASQRYECAIHAYVLMTNHVHLRVTPRNADATSRMMQYIGRRYVPYVNREYRRSGTLWEGRFKASLVQGQRYLFSCYRYIECNPATAGMVAALADYPWSSFRCNALGQEDPCIEPHAEYLTLGRSGEDRQSAYRRMFSDPMDQKLVDELRGCLPTGTPFGNDRFREQIERTLRRKVGYSRRGRPRRPGEDEDGSNKRL
jgi:putative transposase